MIYKLVIHKRAVTEAENIKSYIRDILCNPKAASNFASTLEKEAIHISERPTSYPHKVINGKIYRFAVIKKYLMFFQINEEQQTVYIKSIMYGGSNYRTRL